MMQKEILRMITIQMDLIIPDNIGCNKDAICSYLNNMLNYDPEFFGEFGPENIVEIKDFE